MAKQVQNQNRSLEERLSWYNGRLHSPYCSDKEKAYAAKRISAITAEISDRNNSCVSASSCDTSNYTDGQKYAYGAGVGYGRAKKGKRVDVKDENKESFRKGLELAKRLK